MHEARLSVRGLSKKNKHLPVIESFPFVLREQLAEFGIA